MTKIDTFATVIAVAETAFAFADQEDIIHIITNL